MGYLILIVRSTGGGIMDSAWAELGWGCHRERWLGVIW
jgi:hypothetical protein